MALYENNPMQSGAEWVNARLFRFTSSELHKLMTPAKKAGATSKTAEGYIIDKIAEFLTNGGSVDQERLNTAAINWGNAKECEARECYEAERGTNVDLCGFIPYSAMPDVFGGSPDGLVGEEGLIEIKCPFLTANHVRNLLVKDVEEFRSLHPEYYAQVQGNMLVTGRRWADFVSYDPRCTCGEMRLAVLRIERDEKFIEAAIEALKQAYETMNEYISKLCKKA